MRTALFKSNKFCERKYDEFIGENSDFLKRCIEEFKRSIKYNLCESWNRELTELLFYIICNGSQLRGTGKSRYSEDQIKCKVKNKLIKILPEYWELHERLTYWINFFTSFVAIYYTHCKYLNQKEK
jgi:hypothetical protein